MPITPFVRPGYEYETQIVQNAANGPARIFINREGDEIARVPMGADYATVCEALLVQFYATALYVFDRDDGIDWRIAVRGC